MGKGINKVILIGNLGKDPETRYMPNGGAVTNVVIATSESWKDKETGQKKEETEWHKLVFFNRLGEIAGEYLKKGSKVYVEGKLKTRKWQDQNGNDRWSTEIIASELQMLDSKAETGHQQAAYHNQQTPNKNSGPIPKGSQQQAQPQQQAPSGHDDFDDDIPF